MKILVTGANGMLAKEVKEKFGKENEIIATDVSELDITNEKAVMDYIINLKPEYVINCAAYTAVDKAEENYELADKINGDGPANLAKAAKAAGAKLVHISTDYVFGGDLDISKDYKEDDAKAPVTAYGKTKLRGEQGIEKNMTVIADKGLVGHVISVTDNTAKVQVIVDSASSVSAMISTSEESIICKGSVEDDKYLNASYIDTSSELLVGDSVVTSGIGGIYPKGITIGTIKQVVNTKNITDRYAVVETAVDFSKLYTVLVIK